MKPLREYLEVFQRADQIEGSGRPDVLDTPIEFARWTSFHLYCGMSRVIAEFKPVTKSSWTIYLVKDDETGKLRIAESV